MFRVVAVDLDGTLLRSDATVSVRTVAALRMVSDAGGRTVIVTARPPRFTRMLAQEAGLSGIAICSNGAIVYDLDRDVSTVAGPLSVEVAALAAEAVTRVLPDAAFALETGEVAIVGPGWLHNASREVSRRSVTSTSELWTSTEACVKLMSWIPGTITDEVLASVALALPASTEVTYSGASGMLEIHAAGVSKVDTLAKLCAQWGVAAAEVIAFGDMPNDLPVLRWAGRAIAVANAHPSVLASAHAVTASNDADGVAAVLEDVFVGRGR